MKSFALAAIAMVVSSPAVAQTAKVTGPRIEATVGWDRVALHLDGESEGKSGVTYGGEVGYDFMIAPRTTLGAYVGIAGSSTKDCVSDGVISGCLRAGRNVTIGARLGYMVGNTSLVYVKGGYSNGRIGLHATDTEVPDFIIDDHANLRGFHLGAGAEVGLGHGLYGKVEYTYTNYDNIRNVADAGLDIDTARHRVVIGAGIHF